MRSHTSVGRSLRPGERFRSIEESAMKARLALATIKSPQCLSLETAIQILNIKVAPTASYGVPLIWESLSLRDLSMLEKIRLAYLPQTLPRGPG